MEDAVGKEGLAANIDIILAAIVALVSLGSAIHALLSQRGALRKCGGAAVSLLPLIGPALYLLVLGGGERPDAAGDPGCDDDDFSD